MQVLYIWLPNWPLQRLLTTEPTLAQRAVVLETRDPRRGLLVAAANYAARKNGARIGMRISELSAIKTPDDFNWEVRTYEPHQDLDALCDLAEQAQQFSPIVGLEPVEAEPWHGRSSIEPQGLVLDATGIASLFGGESEYLEAVCQWLKSKGLFGYMCLASNLGSAWAFANFEVRRRSRQATSEPQPASIDQSSDADNNPSTVPASKFLAIDRWDEADLLSQLPLPALRIDSPTVRKLQRLGINSIGQLWQLPRDGLASRLGSQLMKRSDQALGNAAEQIVAVHAHPDWTCEMSLEHPTIAQATLDQVLESLSQQLAVQLGKAGQGALRCVCRLDLVRRPSIVMQLGLFSPSDDAAHLHLLLAGQLEQILASLQQAANQSQPSKPTRPRSGSATTSQSPQPAATDEEGAVWRVQLQATLVGPMIWQQTQLFDQAQWRQKQHLARLIDTLSGRLGRERVLEAKLQRDAEPDQAVALKPLTGRRRDGTAQETSRKINSRLATDGAEPRPTDPLRRPARLLTPPERLASVQMDSDGRLTEFVYENERYRVAHHWGPERLESGWWRGPSMRRDYYRIQTQSGSWLWIYLELHTRTWFLHGLFE